MSSPSKRPKNKLFLARQNWVERQDRNQSVTRQARNRCLSQLQLMASKDFPYRRAWSCDENIGLSLVRGLRPDVVLTFVYECECYIVLLGDLPNPLLQRITGSQTSTANASRCRARRDRDPFWCACRPGKAEDFVC